MSINNIMSAVSDAAQAVNEVVNMTTGAASKAAVEGGQQAIGDLTNQASGLFRDDLFEWGTVKEIGSGILSDAMNILKGEGSVGMIANGAMDRMGLPDWAGDFVGANIDFATMQHHRGVEQLLSGTGGLADTVGAEGVGQFLGAASDKVGMFNNTFDGIALSVATGGLGGGAGLAIGGLGGDGVLGGLLSLGDAGGLGEHLGTAIDLAQNFGDGDFGSIASGMMDMLGGNADLLGSIFEGGIDPQVMEAVISSLGQGDETLAQIINAFAANPETIIGLDPEQILEQAGIAAESVGQAGMAAAELAAQIAIAQAERDGAMIRETGTAIIESDLGQSMLGKLAEAATSIIGGGDAVGDVISSLFDSAASTTAGMVDMAQHDAEVAREIMELLMQMHAMSGASNISDMLGAQVRA